MRGLNDAVDLGFAADHGVHLARGRCLASANRNNAMMIIMMMIILIQRTSTINT